MAANKGIFHLTSAGNFFYCLHAALERYQRAHSKRIEDAFFLVMGANHLREWIAIGYDPKFRNGVPTRPPKNKAENFYIKIFSNADFKIVRWLCNRAKHLTTQCRSTGYSSGMNFDEWDFLVDDVMSFDEGPATGFYVDDEEIGTIVHRLLDVYRNEWFED